MPHYTDIDGKMVSGVKKDFLIEDDLTAIESSLDAILSGEVTTVTASKLILTSPGGKTFELKVVGETGELTTEELA